MLWLRRLPFGFFENRQCDKFALQITNGKACLAKFLLPQRWRGIEWASRERRFYEQMRLLLMIFMALLAPESRLFIKIHTQHFAVMLTARKHSKRLERQLKYSDYNFMCWRFRELVPVDLPKCR
jgi:hypothetical protein